jgi:glycosyltransferase involved in cell wall biosynthesis
VKHIVVVGQTPPPFGGQAIMIQRILEGSYHEVVLTHVRMHFSNEMGEIGRFRIAKLAELFRVFFGILEARFKGAEVLYYPPAGPNFIPAFRDIFLLISTRFLFRATIFHFHASGLSQLIAQTHRLTKFFLQRAYFYPEIAIRLSPSTDEDAKAIRARRELIVPYGIPDDASKVPKVESVEGELTVLFAGVLREDKGILILIEACAQLKHRGVRFKTVCMGSFFSDEIRSRINGLLLEADMKDRFTFPGVLTGSAKLQAFRNADIFCFPTFFEAEAFPVVLLEALNFGLPIVSTQWRGVPDLVDDRCALLVEPKDANAIAGALQEVMSNSDMRRRMGEASRTRYESDFTVERFHKQFEHIFQEV